MEMESMTHWLILWGPFIILLGGVMVMLAWDSFGLGRFFDH